MGLSRTALVMSGLGPVLAVEHGPFVGYVPGRDRCEVVFWG